MENVSTEVSLVEHPSLEKEVLNHLTVVLFANDSMDREFYRWSHKSGNNRHNIGSLGPINIGRCDHHSGCNSGGLFG